MSPAVDPANRAAMREQIASLLARNPFAQFIGMELASDAGELVFVLRYSPHLVGNPLIPALHGGVLGSFLETTAMLELVRDDFLDELPKPIDISIDFLRPGRPVDSFARAIITKRGRRVANVRAEAWQTDKDRPIAILHGHFLEVIRRRPGPDHEPG